MAAIEPVQLRTHFVFRTGAYGVARRAFVESVLSLSRHPALRLFATSPGWQSRR
jgi:hypothetical protein